MIFRDLHPTRIHAANGIVKWNLIGMPYNFKKLAKNLSFTGHLDYTAPEILQYGQEDKLSQKVDIWALGCVLFFICTKRDPFTCENPKLNPNKIKENIRKGQIDMPKFKDTDEIGEPRHAII